MFGDLGAKLKGKAIQTALKAQLKKLPQQEREMLEAILEADPDLLVKMAQEAGELVKQGKDQMSAMMEVGKKYQGEIQKILMQKFKK